VVDGGWRSSGGSGGGSGGGGRGGGSCSRGGGGGGCGGRPKRMSGNRRRTRASPRRLTNAYPVTRITAIFPPQWDGERCPGITTTANSRPRYSISLDIPALASAQGFFRCFTPVSVLFSFFFFVFLPPPPHPSSLIPHPSPLSPPLSPPLAASLTLLRWPPSSLCRFAAHLLTNSVVTG
jgi:hypothetical protein